MKIFVADKVSKKVISSLAPDHEVKNIVGLKPAQLKEALIAFNPDIIVVRSTKVPGPVIAALPNLKLIIRAGAGYDNIDVATASQRGVYVCNCPGKNAIAVAELVMGLIVSADRQIPDCVAELRAGKWDKGRFSGGKGLFGKTIGIIGFGGVGREVAKRARAFGMTVYANDIFLKNDEDALRVGAKRFADPLAMISKCDVVSLHVNLTPETKKMVNAGFLARMKPGAILVNACRGGIIDEDALLLALDAKRIRYCADVFASEPGAKKAKFESAIAKHPMVYGTHHIGASTAQAEEAIGQETVRIVKKFTQSGEALHAVNKKQMAPRSRL